MATKPRDGWDEKHQVAATAAGKKSWPAWIEEIEKRRGHAICGRMRTRHHQPCERPEGHGSGKGKIGACHRHGGRSLAGAASPSFIHGDRVRSATGVSRTLRERMEEQPDVLRMMNQSGALLMVRLEQLVDRIDSQAMGPTALASARAIMVEMSTVKDATHMARLLGELRKVVESESAVDATWSDELYRVIGEVRQHGDSMLKHMIAAREMVPRERVLVLIDRFGIAATEVFDSLPLTDDQKKQARRELAKRMQETMHTRSVPATVSI